MSIVTTKRIEPQLMTCMDVVLSGRLPYADGLGLVKDTDIKEARKSMDIMNIENLSNILFVNLSDGQKQRALIARAICQNPEFLVMDEPTSYMDIRHRLQLMDVVKKLSSAGITIIMSIHEIFKCFFLIQFVFYTPRIFNSSPLENNFAVGNP